MSSGVYLSLEVLAERDVLVSCLSRLDTFGSVPGSRAWVLPGTRDAGGEHLGMPKGLMGVGRGEASAETSCDHVAIWKTTRAEEDKGPESWVRAHALWWTHPEVIPAARVLS